MSDSRRGKKQYSEGTWLDRAVVGSVYRYILYAALGGFVVAGMATGLVLADRGTLGQDVILVVVAGHALLAVFWLPVLYRTSRGSRLIGLGFGLWLVGPVVAYLASGGLVYFLFSI